MRALKLTGIFIALAAVVLMNRIGDALFSAHMMQHLLLIAIAAPLLATLWRAPVSAVTAWCAFVGTFLFWHWPAAFQWAAGSVLTEALEFATILAAATMFWSAAFNDVRLSYGARALFVMTGAVATDLPGVIMVFAPRALCTMPGENAGAWGLTPLQDQQIAGMLMWVPANLIFFGIATWLFSRWIAAPTRKLVTP
jgi:putative membrane protein